MIRCTSLPPEEAERAEELLEERLAYWEALAPGAEAGSYYESVVFPAACERLRQATQDASRSRLAFIPVGTQPYSPILAGLTNPASAMILLHTTTTLPMAQTAAKALEREKARLLLRSIEDGTDGGLSHFLAA